MTERTKDDYLRAADRVIKQHSPEAHDELERRLAHIERQILYRDESMPEWAVRWWKTGKDCFFLDERNIAKHPDGFDAPDYRPDEDECTLAIIEPMEGM